ncbi:lytic murein transglycosylase [Mesorhizobium sp. M7A.T.Ca.TU.009.01.3.2]|nr:lytic murein transglycosylase [Mesorhizobium sp. M7A.T.Ca.TU.009.01.3.2]RUU96051.1 lytic murein transglycosylase [Mesorhizobium sp. M7A.T.Ca.TU.009.01.3.1]
MSRLNTPLCPAGHLPLKGGDWISSLLSPIATVARRAATLTLPISPLEGEMSGRTEGGALAPTSQIAIVQEMSQ